MFYHKFTAIIIYSIIKESEAREDRGYGWNN
jgi:hypothetical protein